MREIVTRRLQDSEYLKTLPNTKWVGCPNNTSDIGYPDDYNHKTDNYV